MGITYIISTSVEGQARRRIPLDERLENAATRRFWSYLHGVVWGSFFLFILRLWTEVFSWFC
jgi:hypothetical protein